MNTEKLSLLDELGLKSLFSKFVNKEITREQLMQATNLTISEARQRIQEETDRIGFAMSVSFAASASPVSEKVSLNTMVGNEFGDLDSVPERSRINALITQLLQEGMTADEINSRFSAFGVSALSPEVNPDALTAMEKNMTSALITIREEKARTVESVIEREEEAKEAPGRRLSPEQDLSLSKTKTHAPGPTPGIR